MAPTDIPSDWLPFLALGAVYLGEKILAFFKGKGVDFVVMARQLEEIQGKVDGLNDDALMAQVRALHEFLPALKSTHEKIKLLHEWHDVRDNAGVKLWYSSKEEVRDLTRRIEDMHRQLELIKRSTSR